MPLPPLADARCGAGPALSTACMGERNVAAVVQSAGCGQQDTTRAHETEAPLARAQPSGKAWAPGAALAPYEGSMAITLNKPHFKVDINQNDINIGNMHSNLRLT